MLAHQDLVEAEGAALERDRRAGQIEEPGAVRPLAGQRAGLVRPRTEPLGPLPPGMDAGELAAWTVVANVLLNMDGVLTKG